MKLHNEKVAIDYNPEASSAIMLFDVRDLTDKYNGTAGYTNNKRGHEKAFKAIQSNFNDETSFWKVIDTLNEFNLRPHSYCSVD